MIKDVLGEYIPEADLGMNLEVQKLKASANPAVFLLLSLIAAQLSGLSCLLFSFLSRTAITRLFIESAPLGH